VGSRSETSTLGSTPSIMQSEGQTSATSPTLGTNQTSPNTGLGSSAGTSLSC
jgi:hypothetical protein